MLFKGDFKGFWKGINGSFLLPVTIGMILGFLILAKFVAWSLSYYPIPAWSFFFGLILVSTIWLLSDIKGWKIADVIWLAIGIGIGVTLCLIKQPDQNNPNTAYWYTCLSGIVAICSMILPGISGSFILVMFGNFNYMLNVLNGTVSYAQYRTANRVLLIYFGLFDRYCSLFEVSALAFGKAWKTHYVSALRSCARLLGCYMAMGR